MHEIGRIKQVQIQRSSLKLGERPYRVYDPAPLLVVDSLALSARGVVGVTADGALKMRVAATGENGEVNDEVRAHLAKLYGVQKSAVTIHSGKDSPVKILRIAASSLAAAPPRPKPCVGFNDTTLLTVQ